jgi:hypothetical protein
MIPEGSYKARAEEGTLGETAGGNPQVAVLLRLLNGGPGVEQQLVTWYGSFGDKSVDRTIESLRHLGWKGDDLSDLQGLGETEVTVVIAHEADLQGQPRARVKWINAGGGLALKTRMDAGSAKAFAEKMRGYVMWHGQRQKGAPGSAVPGGGATSAPSNAGAADGDDIPF